MSFVEGGPELYISLRLPTCTDRGFGIGVDLPLKVYEMSKYNLIFQRWWWPGLRDS